MDLVLFFIVDPYTQSRRWPRFLYSVQFTVYLACVVTFNASVCERTMHDTVVTLRRNNFLIWKVLINSGWGKL